MSAPSLSQQRVLAWLIDLLMCVGLGVCFQRLGWIASVGYWLLRDGLFDGQSLGKRVIGLKVIVQPARSPCTFKESFIRNVLWVVPVMNLVMAVSGLYALAKDSRGRHWGDRLADTEVVRAGHRRQTG